LGQRRQFGSRYHGQHHGWHCNCQSFDHHHGHSANNSGHLLATQHHLPISHVGHAHYRSFGIIISTALPKAPQGALFCSLFLL
jgi:hypothetical protein